VFPIPDFVDHFVADLVRKNGDWPVVGVQRFRRDCEVKKISVVPCRPSAEIKPRGNIALLSTRARNRMYHFVRNCDCDFGSMITLTYPAQFPCDGFIVKKHLKEIKRRVVCRGWCGIWFLEFQRRGAPHFHFLLDLALDPARLIAIKRKRTKSAKSPIYRTDPDLQLDLSKDWFQIVGSGDEKHLRAGVCLEHLELVDAAQRYAAKHAMKPHQKTVPEGYTNVGRFWGKIGNVQVLRGEYVEMTTEQILADYGCKAVSSKGKIRKYLYESDRIENR